MCSPLMAVDLRGLQGVALLFAPNLVVKDAGEPHMITFNSFLGLSELENMAATSKCTWSAFMTMRVQVEEIRRYSLAPLRFYNISDAE